MPSSPRFSQASLDFIDKASKQKKKEWLDRNRDEYEKVLIEPMRHLLETAAKELQALAPGYRFPTRNFARLKRSADNSALHGPFRDWVGVSVSKDSGSRYDSLPNLYFHFANGTEEILSAGGLYVPSADQTKHIRSWIDKDPAMLDELFQDKTFTQKFPELGDERVLKTKPRNYPIDHPRIDLLKLSGFYVWRPFKKKEFFSANFADLLVDDWKEILKLNRILDKWISTWPRAHGVETVYAVERPKHDF